MRNLPPMNQGRLGEPVHINKETFEIVGDNTGEIHGKGTNLQEALALQTALQSGSAPTVKGRPDLLATKQVEGVPVETITGASGQQVQPTVATPEQLAQRSSGDLESFNKTTTIIQPAGETILTPEEQSAKYSDVLTEVIGQGADAGRDQAFSNPNDSYEQQLITQRGALYATLLGETLTPQDLRWLSPTQQQAIRSGNKQNIQAQAAAINSILYGRQELKDKEADRALAEEERAWGKLETYRQYGLLDTLSSDELQGLADSVGLSVEALKSLPANTTSTGTTKVSFEDYNGNEVTQLLDDNGNVVWDSRSSFSDSQVKLTDVPTEYGGECGDKLHDWVEIPPVGNSYKSKMKLMDSDINANNAHVNDVFVQDIGDYGHIGVINAIRIDENGERIFTVTESNYNNDGMVTTDRDVRPSEIDGFGRYPLKGAEEYPTNAMSKEEFTQAYIQNYGEAYAQSPDLNDPVNKAELEALYEEYMKAAEAEYKRDDDDDDNDSPFL